MLQLKRLLTKEQDPINKAIRLAASQLPASVRPVAEYVLESGGKRLRPFLTVTMGRFFGNNDDALYALGAAVEMIHAGTLLHDDILDNAETRRGRPAAHTIFTKAQVILTGDAMLAKAMHLVSAFGDTRLTDCISEAVMQTAEGEIKEFTHQRDASLSHDDYLSIIIGKTAWMLRASCELGALYAKTPDENVQMAARFGMELGIAFQMVDDALDFAPNTGKPRGGDIREGKVTPPLLAYIASLEKQDAADFVARFAKGPLPEEETEALCRAICDGGFDAYARDIAKQHLDVAESLLQVSPHSPEHVVLKQMLAYILKRAH